MVENRIRNPKELAEELKAIILGQDDIIDKVCVYIFQYLLYHYSKNSEHKLSHKSNLLLMGDSGTGKTFIIKQLAEFTGFNFIEINGASLTKDGWSGQSLLDILRTHKKDINSSIFNIIFIDEFDKFCTPQGAVGTSNVSECAQAELLKMMENESLETKIGTESKPINTSNICFIFSGNFKEVRNQRNLFQKTGFIQSQETENEIHHLLEKYGVIPEILGRLSLILETNKLDREDYSNILTNEHSYYSKQKNLLLNLGIELHIEKERLDSILDKVYNGNIGARGLNSEIDKEIQELFLNNSDKVEKILDYFDYLQESQEVFEKKVQDLKSKFYPKED